MLSEDALESLHKTIRKNRLEHTRKNSRENCNKDLLAKLLVASDPYISANRNIIVSKNFCDKSTDIYRYLVINDNNENEILSESDDD